eukprot:gene21999-29057_t
MSTPAPNLFDGHASLALKEEDQKDDVGSKVAGSAPAGEAGEITGEQPAAQTASTAADATAPPAAADATAPPAVANDASAEGVQEVEIPMDINIPAAAANLMARASDTTIQHRAIDAALSALEATSMKKMKAALKSGGTKAFVPKAPKPPPLAEPVEPIVSETIVPMVAAETIAEEIKANVAEGTSQPVDTTARIALRAAMRAYEQTPNPKRIDEAEREADEAVYLAESIYGNIALAQTAADETAADADELTRAVGDNDPPAACTAAKTREITLIEERGAEKMEVARSAIAAADESASKASARAAARKAKSRAAHPAVVSVVKDVIMKVLDQNESKPPPGVRAVENFDSAMAPTIDTPDKGSPDVKASSFVSKIPSIDTATDVDVASPSRSAGSKIPAMVAGSDSRYCLDSCSCTLLESELRSRLRAAVASVPQAAGTILQPPPPPTTPPPPPQNQESKTGPRGRTRTQRQDQNQNQQQQEKQQQQPPLAPALLAACTCPSCDVPLSHRDLRQLLGPSITHRLYTCIAMYLLDTPSTQVGQQDVDLVAAAHSRAAAVAAAAAAAAAAGSSGGCKARASVHLSHQRACCPGTPASFISGLYDSLVGQEQQQKQESTGGAAGAGELQREEEESQVQGGGRGGKKGKKGKGGKGGEGKGRGGGGPGGGRGEGESATWAAGTGYGGGGSSKDEATAGMKKAALR